MAMLSRYRNHNPPRQAIVTTGELPPQPLTPGCDLKLSSISDHTPRGAARTLWRLLNANLTKSRFSKNVMNGKGGVKGGEAKKGEENEWHQWVVTYTEARHVVSACQSLFPMQLARIGITAVWRETQLTALMSRIVRQPCRDSSQFSTRVRCRSA